MTRNLRVYVSFLRLCDSEGKYVEGQVARVARGETPRTQKRGSVRNSSGVFALFGPPRGSFRDGHSRAHDIIHQAF